jgi:RHS repeat-associated protein
MTNDAFDAAGDRANPGSTSYSAAYDAAGDMTCRAVGATTCTGGSPTGQVLGYDGLRQLISWQNASTSPTATEAYAYDGSGERVWQQATSTSGGVTTTTTTSYVLGVQEVTTTAVTGQTPTTATTSYYPLPGGVTASRDSSGLTYQATDLLGTPIAALNPASGLVGEQLRAPYGQPRYAASAPTNGGMHTTFGFTGQREDSQAPGSSGLDYYGARYYDPAVGQFASADDAGANLNRFAYVGGMVENATDPSGQRVCLDDCMSQSAVAAPPERPVVSPEAPPVAPRVAPPAGTDPLLALGDALLPLALLAVPVAVVVVVAYVAYQQGPNTYGQVHYDARAPDPDSSYLQARTRAKRAEEMQIAAETQGWGPPDGLNEFRQEHGSPPTQPRLPGMEPRPGAQPVTQSWDAPQTDLPASGADPCQDGSALVRSQCVSWLTGDSAPPIKRGSAGGPGAGKKFSRATQDAAWRENGKHMCVYCRRTNAPGIYVVDHAIPRSLGGNNTLENAQLVCDWCNRSKGNTMYPRNPPPGFQGDWPPPWWPDWLLGG